jgi:hypothetical protein
MCSSIASEMSMASTTSATSISSDGDGDGDGDGGECDEGDGGECDEGDIKNTNTDSYIEGSLLALTSETNNKTRKKREELSISATKSIKKEKVEIVVNFN